VSSSLIMSFNKKSTVVVAALALAISTSLTGCFGSSDKAADTVKDKAAEVAGKTADGAKDAAGKAVDAAGKTADGAKDAAGKTVGGAKDAAGKALGAAGLASLVSQAKSPLVMANSAIKGGDVAKAKSMVEKFDGVWTKISPQVKTAAGDKFPAIETAVEGVKTAVAGGDKTKIGAALTTAIKGMDGLTAKK
jgi:uncharacterized phage infection (PIP) family protein YhgE